MILYTELTKIEPQADGSIKVYGVASTGARDRAGEIVSPEAMREALPDYLAFGAIREMHEPRAAGAALSAEVDATGATRIAAHIVDPVAVTKVKAGVYKGLSIGGKVLGRDPADATVITRLRLDEISLVDQPCNPEAVIDLWKAEVERAAPSNEAVKAEADRLARAAGKPGRRNDYLAKARENLTRSGPYPPLIPANAGTQMTERDVGRSTPNTLRSAEPYDLGPGVRRDERGVAGPRDNPDGDTSQAPHGSYADPLAAKYPLDTPERIRAAWSAIASPANRAAYADADVAELEARIASAWRAKIDPAGPPSSLPPSPPPAAATGAPILDAPAKAQATGDLRKLADLERALADARAQAQALAKRLDDQAAEIERLKRAPLPPRTAGAHLAKAIAKEEDGGGGAPRLDTDDIARALDAMAPSDRAHLLMKAALSRPIAL